jgi:hypothetical protein
VCGEGAKGSEVQAKLKVQNEKKLGITAAQSITAIPPSQEYMNNAEPETLSLVSFARGFYYQKSCNRRDWTITQGERGCFWRGSMITVRLWVIRYLCALPMEGTYLSVPSLVCSTSKAHVFSLCFPHSLLLLLPCKRHGRIQDQEIRQSSFKYEKSSGPRTLLLPCEGKGSCPRMKIRPKPCCWIYFLMFSNPVAKET